MSNVTIRTRTRIWEIEGFLKEERGMFSSKSVTFGKDDMPDAALAAQIAFVQSPSESEFIERLRAGDSAAFDTLITRYSAGIYSLLYRLTGNREDAGDLLQDTFLKAYRSASGFRGDSDLKTWLFRIAINESRNRFRWWKRRRRDQIISLDSAMREDDLSLHETLADDQPGPEEDTLCREREGALNAALAKLPDKYREAVVLCDIEGMSYEDIAAAVGTNTGTVKSRIARGRDELRRRLKDF